MDDLKGVQTISDEEKRLIALKTKIKRFTIIMIIAAIAIACMLVFNFYPELLRRLLGTQERGDLSKPLTYTQSNQTSNQNLQAISGSVSSTTAYLGIEIQDINKSMAQVMNLSEDSGVVITRVISSSPADAAGLLPGDIIIRFDRKLIKDSSDIQDRLEDIDPGDMIKIVIDRNGQTRTFYVELGTIPTNASIQQSSIPSQNNLLYQQDALQWGCTIAPLTPELASSLLLPASIRGVVVVSVSATGIAKSAGILPGDVITKVNRESTETLHSFYEAIENQPVVVLEIFRNNRLLYIQLQVNNAIPPPATMVGSLPNTTQAPNTTELPKRVAIASTGDNLNAMMASYFGSAPYYIIVDIDTKQFSVIPNNATRGIVSYGMASVQLITDEGANAVIAENYGPQVYQALMAARLTLYRAEPGKVSDVLKQYESYVLSQVQSPTTQSMARNIISTGGAPFSTTDDTDDDEEQSGYKGMPYTIPPQGKYDPTLDPANTIQVPTNTAIQNTAGSSLTLNQQTQYCYCPTCNVVYEHPLKVPCSSLTCNICGNRLLNLSSGTKVTPTLTGGSTTLASGVTLPRRVAIASQGSDLKSNLAPLFGTAPYFLVFDIDTNQYQILQNPSSTDTRSYGMIAAQSLKAQNVGAVIAGSFGSRAFSALYTLNIVPYISKMNTIANVIADYRAGKLSPATDSSLPGFAYTLNAIPTGGSPFTSDTDDDTDEEQSGYKGLPYTIPPKGKYDPELDPANSQNTSVNSTSISTRIPNRVAIAATGNNLNVMIAPVFRTAPYFLIIDISTNQYSAVYNSYLTNQNIQPTQIVISNNVGATIAGSYGPVCYNSLVAANIIPYVAASGKISDILNLYKSGALGLPLSTQILTQTQSQLQTTPLQTQTQLQIPLQSIPIPTQSIQPNVMSVGGSPFTSTDDDEDEEQSGYKGMPYTIPPQGKYDPLLDPTKTVAGTTQRTDYCYCPNCRILVPHPSAVSCSALSCPICENRLMNWDISNQNILPIYPMQQYISGQTVSGVLSAGATSNYVQVPSLAQLPSINNLTSNPQSLYLQAPTQNQIRSGSTALSNSSSLLNLNQQNQYCYCPHCNVIYEHPPGVPCSAMTCTACGNRLISLNGGATNLLTKTSSVYATVTSGQPTTIPPMGQTSAGMVASGQPTTIPPMGQTSAGMVASGQPTTIPPMGQTSAGMVASGQPTTIPPMGQTSAGVIVSGQPTTIPPMGQTSAGVIVSGQPTTIPPMGQTSAGQTSQILQMAQTTAGIAVAGQPEAIPPMGQVTAGVASTDAGALQGTIDGNCVCPICGATIPHERGTACYTIPCPKCGTLMVKEGAVLNRSATLIAQNVNPSIGQLTTAAITIAGVPTNIPAGSILTQPQNTLNTALNTTTTGALQGTIDGNCICPSCGTTVPHVKGTACYTIPCPKCSTLMVNEGAILNQTNPQLLRTAYSAVAGNIPTMSIAQQIAGTTTAGSTIAGIIDLPAMTIAGNAAANICIAATDSTIESPVADIFDKAKYFLIVGLGSIKAIPNPNVKDLLGSGVQSAQLIVSEGAKVLITNDIGIKALEELSVLNVQVYTGVKGTASQALSWYQDSRLTPTSLNTNANADEEHGPPSSSKAKAKGETSTTTKSL